ncbi:hypothetical protein BD408DRAFT_422950 [Parasitella parasitica]|nr:hypothetical protein BD408DRAFT_422950 [Parasitella parasitica]
MSIINIRFNQPTKFKAFAHKTYSVIEHPMEFLYSSCFYILFVCHICLLQDLASNIVANKSSGE